MSYGVLSIRMRSATCVTPGADQAAATARSCPAQELTVPDRITSASEEVSTESPSASRAASRRNAARMASRASRASGLVAWSAPDASAEPVQISIGADL